MNKIKIKSNFDNAANNYDNFSDVQKFSASELVKYLNYLNYDYNNRKIIDIGCGNSFLSKILNNNIVNLDISRNMLMSNCNNSLKIQADMDYLPVKLKYFDLVVSNFSFQWSKNIEELIVKLSSNIAKDKILLFAVPNSDSISELKHASKLSNCNFSFNKLPSHGDIFKYISKQNFKIIHNKEVRYFEKYDNPIAALKKIKKIGANYSNKLTAYINRSNFKLFTNYRNCVKDNFTLSWSISIFICVK